MEFLLSSTSVLVAGMLFAIAGFGSAALDWVSEDRKVAGTWAHSFTIAGSILMFCIAGSVLLAGKVLTFSLESTMPLFDLAIRIDALSAFFIGVISLVATVASLYGLAYQNQFVGHYRLGILGFFYSIFVGSMLLVTMANNGLFFLFAWEVMSVASYFLVVYEYRHKENTSAGFLYLVMAHIGAAFIMLAFVLAYSATASFDFDVWRSTLGSAGIILKSLILGAALIGFGAKAGVVPLHIWLPEAHPAAPSHVSALMSGVMIKTAIFMLVRFFFDFLAGAPLYWGLAIVILGAISSLLGVLYALSEHDIKRLLAYHSVENIGIILLGLGSAVSFAAIGEVKLSAIALAAALFHTLNHALFKALLFLGAGSLVSATGTRNMEDYGGLIKLLPFTSFFFLIGSLAICAFPPFNGFASEWLTFQMLFSGTQMSAMYAQIVFVIAIASLAVTGGLAAACFVKAFGVSFLARSRAHSHHVITESPAPMLIAMGILAVLTLVCGLGASFITAGLVGVAASFVLIDPATLQFPFTPFIAAHDQVVRVVPMASIAILFAIVSVVIAALVMFFTRRNAIVYNRTWDCGTPLTPRMEITATAFSRSIVTIFNGVLRHTKQKSVEYRDDVTHSHYFTRSQELHVTVQDVYRTYLYNPIHQGLLYLAVRTKRIQGGNVNVYVMYVLLTLIGLLLLVTHI